VVLSYNSVESKKTSSLLEHQKGLQMQILEKRKTKEIGKAINKEDMIFLKYGSLLIIEITGTS